MWEVFCLFPLPYLSLRGRVCHIPLGLSPSTGPSPFTTLTELTTDTAREPVARISPAFDADATATACVQLLPLLPLLPQPGMSLPSTTCPQHHPCPESSLCAAHFHAGETHSASVTTEPNPDLHTGLSVMA